MNKFSKYIKGCKDVISKVDEAILDGAVLSREEQFDYDFKKLLLYRGEFKQYMLRGDYRIASFYAQVFYLLREISKEGYSNASAIKYFRKVNRKGLLFLGYFSEEIEGHDENGTLIVDVSEDEYFYRYEIKNVTSLIDALVDFAEYLVEFAEDVTDFSKNYFSGVIEEVADRVAPQVFVNMSKSKTLSHILYKNNSISNIVYLKNYGGEYYGCNEGDIRQSRTAQ